MAITIAPTKKGNAYRKISGFNLAGVAAISLRDGVIADKNNGEPIDSSEELSTDIFSRRGAILATSEAKSSPARTLTLCIDVTKDNVGKALFNRLWPLHEPSIAEINMELDKEEVWSHTSPEKSRSVRILIPYHFMAKSLEHAGLQQADINAVMQEVDRTLGK